MRNKGFTLIELLAVIVILAIIALIATPIILNIIGDVKEETNERSVELYGKAVEQAIAKTQLNGSEIPVGDLSDDLLSSVQYNGNEVVCTTNKLYEDGSIYLGGCRVGTDTKEYTYGVSKIPTPVSFAEDSWETIAANVKAGNLSAYNVGDTKEITLTGDVEGTYTVRIANTSKPSDCNKAGYSQTACGFVIEFQDIITTHNMNSTTTNVGGWPASEMRTYINSTIYNSLPQDLQKVISDTAVVSGHGNTSGEENFTSTDKLYLLSTKEVWGKEGTSNVINFDTAEEETRQLDYYKNLGLSTSNYPGAIKKYKGSAYYCWLRSAASYLTSRFAGVNDYGGWYDDRADYTYGVSPAFRID